jgi:hypothetical protein
MAPNGYLQEQDGLWIKILLPQRLDLGVQRMRLEQINS